MKGNWTSGTLIGALIAFVLAGAMLFDPSPGVVGGLVVDGTPTVDAAGLPEAETMAAVAERSDADKLMRIVFSVLLLAAGAAMVSVVGLIGSEYLARRRRWSVETLLGAPIARLLASLARTWRARLLAGAVLGTVLVAAGAVAMWLTAPRGAVLRPTGPLAPMLALTVIVGGVLAAALLPLWSMYRKPAKLARVVREGSASESPEIRFRRILLVSFQLAVAVALVAASGLLRIEEVDLGLDEERAVTATFVATGDSAADVATRSDLLGSALAALSTSPTLVSESIATPGAWIDRGPETVAANECGRCFTGLMPHPVHVAQVKHHVVMPGFFANRRLAVLDGRPFTAEDDRGGEPVVVINEAYARAHFQDGPAVGRRVTLGGLHGDWHTVIGVVADFPRGGLGRSSSPFSVYYSAVQHPPAAVEVVARVVGDWDPAPPDPGSVMESAMADDGLADLALVQATPASAEVERLFGTAEWLAGGTRVVGWMAGAVALLAVLSVMGAHVRSRSGELGTRAALGASPKGLHRLVLGEATRLAAVSVVLGIWGATAIVGLLGPPDGPLFDGRLFAGVGLLFAAGTVLAAVPGARRAARVEPARALADLGT